MRTTDFVVTLFEGKANPNNLTVAVVMGLNALKQGHSATLILMVEAVELGKPGATEGIDIGAPFKEVGGQLEEYLELGGQVCICNACLIHNGFSPEDMDRECQVFCVSFKKKFYGEGNLPICILHYFIELLYKSIEGN